MSALLKALGQHSCHERLSFGMTMARASCVLDGLLTNGFSEERLKTEGQGKSTEEFL